MPKPGVHTRLAKGPQPIRRWNLEDAKARLSEVVREAKAHGPQIVTQRGHDAVVIVAADDFRALTGAAPSFVDFMGSLGLDGVTLDRDRDTGRDVHL